jgi:DNA-binding Lrp family transcriptional regulator
MARNSGKQTQIENRRMQVAQLYHQGIRRQAELAEKLGVDRSTVSRDLKALKEEWRRTALVDTNETVGEALEEIQYLKKTYWQAWASSRQSGKGDPRFLSGVQWCIAKRCELIPGGSQRAGEVEENASGPGSLTDPEYQRQLAEELDRYEQELSNKNGS